MDTSKLYPVPTGNAGPDILRDEAGRAYWATDGSRITWTDVIECDEDGEPPETLIDLLILHGLWVLRDGNEALVTRDGIELSADAISEALGDGKSYAPSLT
jgi:hypothetical protein